MEFNSPTLRSLAYFYIELELFSCSFSVAKACNWNDIPDNKTPLHGKIRTSSPEVLQTSKTLQARGLGEF